MKKTIYLPDDLAARVQGTGLNVSGIVQRALEEVLSGQRPNVPREGTERVGKLRVGRRVPEHVYEQLGPEPSDEDKPLFTAPTAQLAYDIVESYNGWWDDFS